MSRLPAPPPALRVTTPLSTVLVAAALLAPARAHADPVALRAPGGGYVLAASGPALSVAAWLGDGPDTRTGVALGFAAEGDLRGGPVGLSVAGSRTLVRAPGGLGIDLTLAGSALVPVVAPALAVGATPAMFLGWRGARLDGGLGLVTPVVARLTPDPAVRASLLVEPWLGLHLGPLTLGAGAGMGPVFTTRASWALDLRWMLSIGVEPGRAPAG